MTDLYNNLLKVLSPSYAVKFDGSVLYVSPKKGKKFTVEVDFVEVKQGGGCTKTALLLKLAKQVGLRVRGSEVSIPKKIIPLVLSQEVLQAVGLKAEDIAPENYHEHTMLVYAPGERVEICYGSVRAEEVILLFSLQPGVELGLILNDYLRRTQEVAFKNQNLKKYMKTMRAMTLEKRAMNQLNPVTAQELGVPVINRILVLT